MICAGSREPLVPRTGSYYIYSFDGRLLAEYDILGNCLKDYLYLGNRVIAEYQPSSGEFHYYTPDQIGSTRLVTGGTGNIEYSAAFNAYGGVQRSWVDDFDPSVKYAGKERDEETEMDYYGARYYKHSSYRWISPDPVSSISDYDPQTSNLYAFAGDNPISYVDVFGLWVYKGNPSEKQRRAFCAWVEWLKAFDPLLGNQFSSEGDPSDGITVVFADLKGDDVMQEKPTPPITENGIVKATFELTIDPSLGTSQDSVDARISLGHEAEHMLNYGAYIDALRSYPNDPAAAWGANITRYEDERQAYMVSIRIAGFLGRETFIVGGKYDLMNHNPGETPFNYRMYDSWCRKMDPKRLSIRLSGDSSWDR